jgi:hypothetical protein
MTSERKRFFVSVQNILFSSESLQADLPIGEGWLRLDRIPVIMKLVGSSVDLSSFRCSSEVWDSSTCVGGSVRKDVRTA